MHWEICCLLIFEMRHQLKLKKKTLTRFFVSANSKAFQLDFLFAAEVSFLLKLKRKKYIYIYALD